MVIFENPETGETKVRDKFNTDIVIQNTSGRDLTDKEDVLELNRQNIMFGGLAKSINKRGVNTLTHKERDRYIYLRFRDED